MTDRASRPTGIPAGDPAAGLDRPPLAQLLRETMAEVLGGLDTLDVQGAGANLQAQVGRLHAAAEGLSHLVDQSLAAETARAQTASDLREPALGIIPAAPDPASGASSPTVPPAPWNLTAFDGLLVMAGPETAADLIDRFCLDLDLVQDQIVASGLGRADKEPQDRTPPDLALLCKALHNLVSLAGTAGATELSDDARALHDKARHLDIDTLRQLCPALLGRIAGLAFEIARRKPGPGYHP